MISKRLIVKMKTGWFLQVPNRCTAVHGSFVRFREMQLYSIYYFFLRNSPNLNIIERLWRFTKKKILYGKYDDTPQKFHDAIRDFFRHG
jgi:hypothetical protein